jgi:TatD DNase family protein
VLIDTHCHLGDSRFDADRPDVVDRARRIGVSHVIVVAESGSTAERALEVARTFGLSATAGVHPHEASSWSAGVAERIETLLADPAVVAVGETGLDYHYNHSPPEAQRNAFWAHIELARRFRRPVVVHARDADEDIAAMIRDAGSTVVLHSFSAGERLFETGLDIGAYFSFSGMVTFKNWAWMDRVRECPADRLLVETDSPFLAPVPNRGKRNEPAFVKDVAARVAEIRGVTLEEIARQTSTNAARCFGDRVLSGTSSQD